MESRTTKPCMLLLDSLEIADPRRFEPDIRSLYWTFIKLNANWITKRQLGKFLCWCRRYHNKGIKMIVDVLFSTLWICSCDMLQTNLALMSEYPSYVLQMDENWFSGESMRNFCSQVTSFCSSRINI